MATGSAFLTPIHSTIKMSGVNTMKQFHFMRNDSFHFFHPMRENFCRIKIICLIQILLNTPIICNFKITGNIYFSEPQTTSLFHLCIRVIGTAMENQWNLCQISDFSD